MKKSVLILVGILTPLIAGEIVLRLMDYGTVRPELNFGVHMQTDLAAGRFELDPELFWREAGGPATDAHRRLHIVRPGDPVPPKQGKFRIICLGDSCTRLSGSGWPYSILLEMALGPDRVEVFNASLPGYSSHQGLVWLRRQLLDYEPDLLIVYFGWNDHWRSTGVSDKEYAGRQATGHLRLLDLFRRQADEPALRVSPEDFAANLRQIADLVGRRGGQTLLVTAPSSLTFEGDRQLRLDGYMLPDDLSDVLHRQYRQVVKSLEDEVDPRVVDAANVFAFLSMSELLMYRDGVHLTDYGHLGLAAMLSDFIKHHYLGDSTPPGHPAAVALVVIAQHLTSQRLWDEALNRYRQALTIAPATRGPTLGLAWVQATCPVDSLRDGQAALAALAELGQEYEADPFFLDVKAAVLAEQGSFTAAAATARQTLDRLESQARSDGALAAEIRARLALYESGQPYREAAAAAGR